MSLFLDTISTFDNLESLYLDIKGTTHPRAITPIITRPENFTSVPANSGTRRPISVHRLTLKPRAVTIVHHLPKLQSIHMEYGPWDRNNFRSLLNALTGKNITCATICLPDSILDDEWLCE
jgi:hypothetical protein